MQARHREARVSRPRAGMRDDVNEPARDLARIVNVLLTVVAVVVAAAAAGKAQGWPARASVTPVFASSLVSPASAPSARPSNRTALAAARVPAVRGSDTTEINQYVSYDARAKTVAITLIAAANSTLGGFNFNGGSSGDQTITVPLGWTVSIDFHNHDVMPHSALVIKNQTPIPAMLDQPALPRASTSHLSDGLPPQTGNDTMHFTATPAGDYLIACGVPGHAATGMNIHFVVSPRAAAPTNTGTIAAP